MNPQEIASKNSKTIESSCLINFLGPSRAVLVFFDWSGWSELGFGLSRLPAAIAYTEQLN